MRMFTQGQWREGREAIEVRNPFDNAVVDTVPRGTADDVTAAIDGLVAGAEVMRRLSGYERFQILNKTAVLMGERLEELATVISREEGKVLAESRIEVQRARETMELSAEEAKRITGEVLPLDGASTGKNKLGFTLRVPCGIVAAITPFNFPLNLVVHKVGPALAGGNAVILKPASDTPLSALKLVEILLEAGLPPQALACVTGPGGVIGDAIARDPRVRKISFTGSRDVGERLCQVAGLKRVTMELGSNSPLIVMPDADLQQVAEAAAVTAFANAGQVCISTQRMIGVGGVYDELLERLTARVGKIRAGNQLDAQTNMGPMVRESDARRVGDWVDEAVKQGARIMVGGSRQGAVFEATVLADVKPDMKVTCDEVFGPTVAVTRAETIEQAIAMANDTRYGLSAAIFTKSLDSAMRFAREVQSGNIHINWGTMWRADLMPYGGLKDSGFGKEGPKYAIQEMTETKMVVIHGV